MSQEDKLAIERCLRSFIIKSIHAIVQARNGLTYKTSCVSDVGSRNNMMLNIEEDPDVGATIKSALDSAFTIQLGDVISLEILSYQPREAKSLAIHEIWQFRLEESCKDEAKPAGGEAESEFVTEDFKQSRLFERLGTLLKSVVVSSRLLPAYKYSREQDPSKFEMGYAVRRGSVDLTRLGSETQSRCIGQLAPGLKLPFRSPEKMSSVVLDVTVHYRTRLPPVCTHTPQPITVEFKRGGELSSSPSKRIMEEEMRRMRFADCSCGASGGAGAVAASSNAGVAAQLSTRRVRPVFADDDEDDRRSDEEAYEDDILAPGLLGERGYRPCCVAARCRTSYSSGEAHAYDDEEDETESDSEDGYNDREVRLRGLTNGGDANCARVEVRASDREHASATPLPLPFSTVGDGGSRLTHLFTELRENTSLELFQNPTSSGGTKGGALFDANALAKELERHEGILKEFDDFMSDFNQREVFRPPHPQLLVQNGPPSSARRF